MQGKRWIALLLAASLVAALALTGCSAKTTETDAGAEPVAQADDGSLKKVQDAGELVVGLAPFYAPFESTNEDTKEIEGFDIDLMNAITEKMGVKATYKPAEWQALLGGIEKGDYDVIFSAMSKKEAAEANVEFSDVYFQLPDVIITAAGNPKGINGKVDLKGKVVGVQLGSGSEQLADEIKDEVGFKEVKKYKLTQDAMNDLKVGRIDAVLAGYTFALEQKKADPSYVVLEEPLVSADLVGVFPKGATTLVNAFNEALAELKADGTYDALVKKWLSAE
ncbi:MAG: amino acid ABC transporter substrate-binding protein [Actinobacteria bacterium]|nr:MAG: amino acid ABC transporter substrate-binding protein [Actinomycetota bacterium]